MTKKITKKIKKQPKIPELIKPEQDVDLDEVFLSVYISMCDS